MSFDAYSEYYDLLYQDKNYAAEVEYVAGLLKRYAPGCRSILELGCGTGKHAELLAKKGYWITGIELSESMLNQARTRAADFVASQSPGSVNGQFRVQSGDARWVRLDQQFDIVISLFHVVSYQTSNQDICQMLESVAAHLASGGIFIFDLWYGPAVLTCRPEVRAKRMENDRIQVVRLAEPTIDYNANQVDVHYTVWITDKATGAVQQVQEKHPMRYYFTPELQFLLKSQGLELIGSEEWLTAAAPSEKSWGTTFVARKI